MYLYPEKGNTNQAPLAGEFVIVTGTHVNHFQFEQTAKQKFKLEKIREEQIPFKQASNVYVTEICERQILISNLPTCYTDFSLDKQIYIYHVDLAKQNEKPVFEIHEIDFEEDDAIHKGPFDIIRPPQ